MTESEGWIGVDLDGTLAYYSGTEGPYEIGPPLQPMLERVKLWLDQGRDVRIVTARVDGGSTPSASREGKAQAWSNVVGIKKAIQDWTERHLGRRLPVTRCKDYEMRELWDDRAVRVNRNVGTCPLLPSEDELAVQLVLSHREEQIADGKTAAHNDRMYCESHELLEAAISYAIAASGSVAEARQGWPFDLDDFQLTGSLDDLARSAAYLLAEISCRVRAKPQVMTPLDRAATALRGLTAHDRLQLEQAASGCIGGTLSDWPELGRVLGQLYVELPGHTAGAALQVICGLLLNSEASR